LQFFFG